MSDRFSYTTSDESSVPPSPRDGHGTGRGAASGQGIQMTIQNLQNEQERVQKKTFTNWMNTYLCQRHPPIKVENLFEEVKDGVVLLSLLEVLSGEKLPMEKGTKLRRPHHLANISTALNFLEKKKIKLVNINATSIADGKPAIVLGLVWTIILYFQIEETINAVPQTDGEPKKKAALPKQSLLDWAESVLSKKYGLHIKDFGKSWKDGVAFNAMIHNIRPDLVDMDQIRRQQARINLEHAFSTAETQLGIPRLLDPEDVDVEKPDEKSIMTYVAQFLKAYPDAAGGVTGTNIDTAEKEQKAYNSLMTWLNTEAQEVLATTLEPVTDRESEFMDYLGFKTEFDRREPLYLKIGEKVLSGRALKITRPDWEKLDIRWQEVDEQVRQWLLKLDASLPGRLGKLGQWLYDAEKLLRKKEEATDNADDMAALYAELAREHRDFFKDLDEWKQFFAQIKRAGRYEGMMLHGPQFDHLSKRLDTVTLHSTVRQNRLDYTHMRYKLLAYLVVAETKLGEWTVKYGYQDTVEDLLKDYVDFVERQRMFESYDKTFAETKKVAEKYKMGGADKMEASQMDHFLEEISGRWKKVSVEIKSVRSMLEETVTTWKRYNACVEVLTVWLTDGEQVMQQSLEEKEEFFKDLAQYQEKHKLLNESANFLIDVTTDPIAEEIKRTLLTLNKRFTELVEGFQSFRQNEVIGKARTEYETGVANVESWLTSSSDILQQQIKCIHAELKAYLLELDNYNSQIQGIEDSFKVTTKTAQSLVRDSSQDVVTHMLETLSVQKEAILKLRKEIPERIKYLKAVLPNVESLETGILDLERWLDEGQQLLDSHKLDGTAEETDARLERHKGFFTETTYQKSILESKNKVFQKISGTKTKLTNVDFTPAEELMSSANEKFQNVVTSAKDWERKLETLARLWRSLQQRQQQLEEWLDTAQNILDDSEDDPDSLIRKHKMFFDRIDKRMMSDYEANANEILQQLDTPERKLLSQTLGHLKERWEHVLHHAPIKLLKLEFAIPEDKFEQSMEKAEVALQQAQEQIKRNQNVKEALAKHRKMFQEGDLVSTCEQWLEQMKNLSQQLLKMSRDEKSLDQRYKNHLERWKKLRMIADDTHVQLKQLPERWKEYHQKMGEFDGWVQNVEKLIQAMAQEDLTGDEYKDMLAKFQKEMRNMNKYQDDAKWLEQCLDELIKDAPDADAKREENVFVFSWNVSVD